MRKIIHNTENENNAYLIKTKQRGKIIRNQIIVKTQSKESEWHEVRKRSKGQIKKAVRIFSRVNRTTRNIKRND